MLKKLFKISALLMKILCDMIILIDKNYSDLYYLRFDLRLLYHGLKT